MQFFFFWILFCFVFVVCLFVCSFFNNSVASSICKLPIRSEIYNCTVKNTNKVFIIIIIIIVIIIDLFYLKKQFVQPVLG